jgi:predicted ATPase
VGWASGTERLNHELCHCIDDVTTLKVLHGMGVRNGVTVIVGGGFHGKSTLLEALQSGVYDKVQGTVRVFGRNSRSRMPSFPRMFA